jgi:hypothetical protein
MVMKINQEDGLMRFVVKWIDDDKDTMYVRIRSDIRPTRVFLDVEFDGGVHDPVHYDFQDNEIQRYEHPSRLSAIDPWDFVIVIPIDYRPLNSGRIAIQTDRLTESAYILNNVTEC